MNREIVSVGELTGAIKRLLEDGFGEISVKGEISNFVFHSSGHRYFTLKDEAAQISCAFWRGRKIDFQPADGMKVVATGEISVYPPRGQYQLVCTSLTPLGKGDLFLAFEALKKKLAEKGYFAPDRKRPLPVFPRSVGIATSPTGAAVRDMFATIEKRFPALTIYFRPTKVQGEGARKDIVKAIAALENTPAEFIIIGRGGGSLEDLWEFNSEEVADAIFNSRKPIVSAVGHETDFTISDFCADVRAATPTAAAVIATPKMKDDLLAAIADAQNSMTRNVGYALGEIRAILESSAGESARRRIIEKIRLSQQRAGEAEIYIDRAANRAIGAARTNLEHIEKRIAALAPLSPLKRGFAVLFDRGKAIPNTESLSSHREFEIMRENETALAKVVKTLPKPLF